MTAEVPPIPARRRIGRRPFDPAGASTQESILAVAQQAFADNGYAATTLRDIAERAGVTQALIVYYFGNKQGLFEVLFRNLGLEVVRERQALLDALLARPEPPSVRDIVAAYLAPQFALTRRGPAASAFMRIQARLYQEFDGFSLRLRRELYDPSTRNYIRALVTTCGMSEADAHWRMMFAVGTYLYALSGFDRMTEVSDGRFGGEGNDELVRRLTDFLVAGMEARPAGLA